MSGGISAAAWAAMAAAAVSATVAIYSADTASNNADAQAEMARRDGEQKKDSAVAQAEKIRKAGQQAAGRANAAMAASGVAIGEGTPIIINEAIYKDSEDDAYSTLLSGTRNQRASNDEGAFAIADGKAAKTAGYGNATASLLSSGASYGKWQTSQKKGG